MRRLNHFTLLSCSKSFHSLIQLSLAGGSNIDPASKEEAWGYYTDVLNVIETKAKVVKKGVWNFVFRHICTIFLLWLISD